MENEKSYNLLFTVIKIEIQEHLTYYTRTNGFDN